jgi:hypothetical protein
MFPDSCVTYVPDCSREQLVRFRHSAGFGKRIEYWIVGRMLKEGIDVFLPLVDDDAIDAIVRRDDGTFGLVQIKARSSDVKFGDAALFAAITHESRADYWFVFYSERLDLMWIMTSKEFLKLSVQNKTGKNVGKRSIWFNGKRKDPATGETVEYCKPQWTKYLARDFSRIRASAG